MKMSGFDDFQKKLTKLANNARKLEGSNQVPLTDLLTESFVAKHSKFSNADELFKASGLKIESPEDFAAIPDAEWDTFIRTSTSFSTWKDMLGSATKEWTKKQLGIS